MKEYIRDDGRMRVCTSNVAKMNILEYMYYYRYRLWNNIIDAIKEFLDCWSIFVNMLLILILPLAYPIMAWIHIQDEREVMKEKYGKNWKEVYGRK